MLKRQTIALLAVIALVGAAVTAAVVFRGPPRVTLSQSPTEADHVTMYQNGLTFVELGRTFTSAGGDTVLVFSVPTTAIFESLLLEGRELVIKELRSSMSASPLINPGDQVTVHIGDQTFSGTVLSMDGGQLLLGGSEGTTIIDVGRADALEIAGRAVKGSGPGSIEVTALVDAPEGAHDVHLSFLARGPGWTPSYVFESDTGAWTFFATLTGLDDWKNVSLDLVSGAPNVVYSPPPDYRYDLSEYKMSAAASPAAGLGASYDQSFGSSVPLGDLHRYHYARAVNFTRGETVRLPVLQGEVEVLRHYYELSSGLGWAGAAGDRNDLVAFERYELKNTLSEPLPPGTVRVYIDGTWVGEDTLQSVPKGDRTNITVSQSQEIKGRSIARDIDKSRSVETHTYELTVQNFKDAGTADIRLVTTYPDYGSGCCRWSATLVTTDPPADETYGRTIVWDDDLPAGTTHTFRLTYRLLLVEG